MNPQQLALESVEMEAIASLSNAEVASAVPARWQRKMMAAAAATATASAASEETPRKRMLQESQMDNVAASVASPMNVAKRPTRCAATSATAVTPARLLAASGSSTSSVATDASTTTTSDRFIPTRSALDLENASFAVRQAAGCASPTTSALQAAIAEATASASTTTASATASALGNVPNTPRTESSQEFHRALKDTMGAGESRVLAFRKKAPAPAQASEDVLFASRGSSMSMIRGAGRASALAVEKPSRVIPSTADKVLDAPDLLNDFYINPLDWSASNQLGVGLGPTVYLWTASTGAIGELCSLDEARGEYVSSLKFVQEGGGYVAIGSSEKVVSLWDVESQKCLRKMSGHMARVSALAWNGHILTSAGRDAQIIHHDVRVANHVVARLGEGHAEEVCSLAWSTDGSQLASGSADNSVCVWDARGGAANAANWRTDAPRLRLTHHTAAVKALAWCPYQRNVLATGGGTSDRSIKIWNTSTGTCDVSVDTGSQVCALAFNPHSQELLSSHGFSDNQLSLWKFPTLTKLKDLTGHTARVLHLAVSPDGTTVCSAAADESLRLWKVFGGAAPVAAAAKSSSVSERRPLAGSRSVMSIR